MYPAEQRSCSLGGDLSRPSPRWRGGHSACSRLIRPGSDSVPGRRRAGRHGHHGGLPAHGHSRLAGRRINSSDPPLPAVRVHDATIPGVHSPTPGAGTKAQQVMCRRAGRLLERASPSLRAESISSMCFPLVRAEVSATAADSRQRGVAAETTPYTWSAVLTAYSRRDSRRRLGALFFAGSDCRRPLRLDRSSSS
jgi:hypothetical protein